MLTFLKAHSVQKLSHNLTQLHFFLNIAMQNHNRGLLKITCFLNSVRFSLRTLKKLNFIQVFQTQLIKNYLKDRSNNFQLQNIDN